MKELTQIENERPYYYVSIKGKVPFESGDIDECKEFLCEYVKKHKKEIVEENELWEYFIGMYAIDILDY